jgi:hypothetical protein
MGVDAQVQLVHERGSVERIFGATMRNLPTGHGFQAQENVIEQRIERGLRGRGVG